MDGSDEDEILTSSDDGDFISSVGYNVKHVLNEPVQKNYTVQELYDMLKSEEINIKPKYQRDFVWSEQKQVKLIDSVMRNFPITSLTFHVVPHNRRKEERICLDGKQRLLSIMGFMDGMIPHRDKDSNRTYFYKPSAFTKRNQNLLSHRAVIQFQQKTLQVVEYRGLAEEDVVEMFQRLQHGMPLTPAERLQALATPWADFAHVLQKQYFDASIGLDTFIPHTTRRKETFKRIVEVMYQLHCSDHRKTPTFGSKSLEDFLGMKGRPGQRYKKALHRVLSRYTRLARSSRHRKCFLYPSKVVAPIEFVMGALLVATHGETLSNAQLSDAISDMRADARSKHGDISRNAWCYATMRAFIDTEVGIQRKVSASPTPPFSPVSSSSPSPSSSSSDSPPSSRPLPRPPSPLGVSASSPTVANALTPRKRILVVASDDEPIPKENAKRTRFAQTLPKSNRKLQSSFPDTAHDRISTRSTRRSAHHDQSRRTHGSSGDASQATPRHTPTLD